MAAVRIVAIYGRNILFRTPVTYHIRTSSQLDTLSNNLRLAELHLFIIIIIIIIVVIIIIIIKIIIIIVIIVMIIIAITILIIGFFIIIITSSSLTLLFVYIKGTLLQLASIRHFIQIWYILYFQQLYLASSSLIYYLNFKFF